MAADIRKTRVIELIEDGRFDDVAEDMARALLKRLKVIEARKKRQERLRKRREKAAVKRRTA